MFWISASSGGKPVLTLPLIALLTRLISSAMLLMPKRYSLVSNSYVVCHGPETSRKSEGGGPVSTTPESKSPESKSPLSAGPLSLSTGGTPVSVSPVGRPLSGSTGSKPASSLFPPSLQRPGSRQSPGSKPETGDRGSSSQAARNAPNAMTRGRRRIRGYGEASRPQFPYVGCTILPVQAKAERNPVVSYLTCALLTLSTATHFGCAT